MLRISLLLRETTAWDGMSCISLIQKVMVSEWNNEKKLTVTLCRRCPGNLHSLLMVNIWELDTDPGGVLGRGQSYLTFLSAELKL